LFLRKIKNIIGKGCIYYVGIQYVTIYNVVQVNSMVNHWSYRLHREGNDYGLHIIKNLIILLSRYRL